MSKPLVITDYVDENLKLVRDDDGTDTPIQLSKDRIKIVGDLDVTGVIDSPTVYPGQIIGYTRLQGDLVNTSSFEIQNSITVEDDTHKVSFITPPSENVEITATFFIDPSSTDTRISAGLSDANATDGYNAVAQEFEYDGNSVWFTDDEANDSVITIKWVLNSTYLATVGANNTFWIGLSTDGATKTAYLRYGLRSATGAMEHPFIIKATALPIGIYDGQ